MRFEHNTSILRQAQDEVLRNYFSSPETPLPAGEGLSA
jgi:hypothetical protein